MDDNAMRKALTFSPLGIAVDAWQTDENGEYVSYGEPNHWTVLYKMDDKGRKYVFDSYAPYYKVLSPTHQIKYCKRYSLAVNTEPVDVYSPILKDIIKTLSAILITLKNYVAKNIKKTLGAIFSSKD